MNPPMGQPMGQPMGAEMGGGGQPAFPVAANPPMPPAPPMQSAESGAVIKSSGGIREFFEDINLLDVTISAFIVASVLYTVHYYRYMLLLEKSGYQDLSARLGKIESAVEARKAEMNAAGRMKDSRRQTMRLR